MWYESQSKDYQNPCSALVFEFFLFPDAFFLYSRDLFCGGTCFSRLTLSTQGSLPCCLYVSTHFMSLPFPVGDTGSLKHSCCCVKLILKTMNNILLINVKFPNRNGTRTWREDSVENHFFAAGASIWFSFVPYLVVQLLCHWEDLNSWSSYF